MTITIEDRTLEDQLQETSTAAGKSVPEFVVETPREKVAGAVERKTPKPLDWEAIRQLQDRVAAMPVLDPRSDDEIMGYNEHGYLD